MRILRLSPVQVKEFLFLGGIQVSKFRGRRSGIFFTCEVRAAARRGRRPQVWFRKIRVE
jgi:hypothetical protein